MDKDEMIVSIKQRLPTEPCDEFITIRCTQDGLQGVFWTSCGNTFGNGEEKKVVVAQNDNGPISQILDVAEDT